jgi:hypothetical protein
MLCEHCEALSFFKGIKDHNKLLMLNIISKECDMSSVLGVLSVPWHTFICIQFTCSQKLFFKTVKWYIERLKECVS